MGAQEMVKARGGLREEGLFMDGDVPLLLTQQQFSI